MKLLISYYPSDDILLMENGRQWKNGSNMAQDVVAYADVERKPVAIEISGLQSCCVRLCIPAGP